MVKAKKKVVAKKHPATGEKPVGKIKSNEEVRVAVKEKLPNNPLVTPKQMDKHLKIKSCIWCARPLLNRADHGEGKCDTAPVKPPEVIVPAGKQSGKTAKIDKARAKSPVQSVPVVEPEDDPKGAGLSKAVMNTRDVVDDLPEQDDNTEADQKRRADTARKKAKAAVLELPTSPEGELILKSTQLPADVRVMRYHNSNQWQSCLMWLTREERPLEGKPVKGQKALTETVVSAIHVIRQGDDGGLLTESKNPKESMYFAEIIGGYPIGPAVKHFREHADTVGSSKKVRELLGLKGEPPPQYKQVVQINEETGEREVVKVAKPPKGGNSNKPTPNPEIDELYERAARLLGVKEADLRVKYGHLNNGMQSMNLRNRLRAKGHNT